MVIKQGDIFWVNLGKPSGSAPGFQHPHVVIQNNIFNLSKINTVVVCTLISSLKRAKSPGNVLLTKGEANLNELSSYIAQGKTDIRIHRNDVDELWFDVDEV